MSETSNAIPEDIKAAVAVDQRSAHPTEALIPDRISMADTVAYLQKSNIRSLGGAVPGAFIEVSLRQTQKSLDDCTAKCEKLQNKVETLNEEKHALDISLTKANGKLGEFTRGTLIRSLLNSVGSGLFGFGIKVQMEGVNDRLGFACIAFGLGIVILIFLWQKRVSDAAV